MGMSERKEKERDRRRNEIIEAAESLFFEKGYDHATMDEIAKKSELTKRTIYTYFSSKEELQYEIMLRGFEKLNQLIDGKLSDETLDPAFQDSGIEKIKLLGHAFMAFSIKYPYYFRTIMNYENQELELQQSTKSELISRFYAAGQYSMDLLERFILEGIAQDEIIKSSDPKILSLVLWSSMTGLLGLLRKKEKYIAGYFNENTSLVLAEGFKIIVNSIKKEKVDSNV